MTLVDIIALFEAGEGGTHVGAGTAREIVKTLRQVETERAELYQTVAVSRMVAAAEPARKGARR